MNDKTREMILDIFHDYDHKDFSEGALECVRVLIGESDIRETSILKAYIIRKLLNTEKPFFIIKYGSESRFLPKYHEIVNELFESKEDAYKYVNELKPDTSNYLIDYFGKPYGVFEI